MKTRALSLLLSLIILFALVACTENGVERDTADPTDITDTTNAPAASEATNASSEAEETDGTNEPEATASVTESLPAESTSEPPVVDVPPSINSFSEFLDNENFIARLSQSDLFEQMEKYAYEGEKITDAIEGFFYDSAFGGGFEASGELFGYKNDFYGDGENNKYSNSFYTHVALDGLRLPYGINFNDALTETFEKIGIETDPYDGFVGDSGSDTVMTLFDDGSSTLIFRDLKRTKEPIDYENPYELIFKDTKLLTLDDGRIDTVERTVLLSFADHDGKENDALCYLSVSVEENYQQEIDHSGYHTTVRILEYTWDGWGISEKVISACDAAYWLIDALEGMQETGEHAEKISDAPFDVDHEDFSVARGTMWLEVGSTVWRLDPDWTQLCRVERHLGEGVVLHMSEEFKRNLRDAWYYYPYDSYTGTYRIGSGELTLEHVYEAYTSVSVQIKEIVIQNEHHPINTVTLELLSRMDQRVAVDLRCQRSEDDLADGAYEEVELHGGAPLTVTLDFGGWKDSRFWVYVFVDNTRIELTVEP